MKKPARPLKNWSITSCNNNGMRDDDDGPNNGPISRVEPTAAATRCVWLRYHRYMALKMDPRCCCCCKLLQHYMPCGPQKNLQLHFVPISESHYRHTSFLKKPAHTPTINIKLFTYVVLQPARLPACHKIWSELSFNF